MSAVKGGRKVVKANRVSRSKPSTKTLLRPSAPPCAYPHYEREMYGMPAYVSIISALEWDRNLIQVALRDALRFYDRLAGNIKDDTGWSVAEVLRLAEIRALIAGPTVPANSSPAVPQTPPEAIPSQASPENRRKSAPRA